MQPSQIYPSYTYLHAYLTLSKEVDLSCSVEMSMKKCFINLDFGTDRKGKQQWLSRGCVYMLSAVIAFAFWKHI